MFRIRNTKATAGKLTVAEMDEHPRARRDCSIAMSMPVEAERVRTSTRISRSCPQYPETSAARLGVDLASSDPLMINELLRV